MHVEQYPVMHPGECREVCGPVVMKKCLGGMPVHVIDSHFPVAGG